MSMRVKERDRVDIGSEELKLNVGYSYSSSGRFQFSDTFFILHKGKWKPSKEFSFKVNWERVSRSKAYGTVTLYAKDFRDGTLIKAIERDRKGTTITYYIVDNGRFRIIGYKEEKEKVGEYKGHEIYAKVNVLENGFKDVICYFTRGIYSSEVGVFYNDVEQLKESVDKAIKEYDPKFSVYLPQDIIDIINEKKPEWCDGVVITYLYGEIHILPLKRSKYYSTGYYFKRSWNPINLPEKVRERIVSIYEENIKKVKDSLDRRRYCLAIVGEKGVIVKRREPLFGLTYSVTVY